MNFLAISTSQFKASVSYFKSSKEFFTLEVDRVLQPSFWLNELLDFFEKFDNNLLKSLDYIAVDIGPGSFTGIKVGLAFVKGISLAGDKDIPIVPISSLEGYCSLAPIDKVVIVLMNAGKGKFYFASFRHSLDDNICLVNPKIMSLEEVTDQISQFDKNSVFVVCEDGILAIKGDAIFTQLPSLSKGIGMASQRQFRAGKFVKSIDLCPLYLRVSDAEANLIK